MIMIGTICEYLPDFRAQRSISTHKRLERAVCTLTTSYSFAFTSRLRDSLFIADDDAGATIFVMTLYTYRKSSSVGDGNNRFICFIFAIVALLYREIWMTYTDLCRRTG